MHDSPPPLVKSSTCMRGLAVFLTLLAAYLLTFNATFRSDDEHILAARAQSLALWGKLEEPQVYGNQRERDLLQMGDAATQVEPGQSAIGASLYLLGLRLDGRGAQALFMQNAVITAFTGATVYATVIVLGMESSTAVVTALLFGLGTLAWPYATTYFRDPLAALAVAVAFLGWSIAMREGAGRRGWGFALVVAALVGGVLAKNIVLVLLPSFLIPLLIAGLRVARPPGRRWRWAAAGVLAIAACLAAAALIPSTGPWARFSLSYYASLARHSAGSLVPKTFLPGLLGPFLSPAESLLLFSPPLVLLALVPRRWWSQRWLFALPALLATIGFALAQALFYRSQWAGAVGWGLRPMLPALPPLMVCCAPAVDRLRSNLWGWLGVGAAAVIGVIVQLSAVLVPWAAAYEGLRQSGLVPYTFEGTWDPRRLLILYQLPHLFSPTDWDVAWTRIARQGSAAWIWPLLVGALTLGQAMVICRTAQRSEGRRLVRRAAVGAGVLAILIIPIVTFSFAGEDPIWYSERADLALAVKATEREVRSGDVVVVDSYATPLWFSMMNAWGRPVRWYSLPFEIPGTEGVEAGLPPSSDTVRLLQGLLASPGRLWFMTSSDAPASSLGRESAWLEANALRLSEVRFGGPADVVVRSYELRP